MTPSAISPVVVLNVVACGEDDSSALVVHANTTQPRAILADEHFDLVHVAGVWQWIALPLTLSQLSTICLSGVSILEHEAQFTIIAIVNVNVGEWILVGGLLRTDDVLNICLTISPV